MTRKVLILADSCALPRGFPPSEAVHYEETYPYLLKKRFPEFEFAVIAMGGMTSVDLVGQALSYFNHWNPDIIIVQAGSLDCRPQPISNFWQLVLNEYEFLGRLKALIYKPSVMVRLMRIKTSSSVPFDKFRKNMKKLKTAFADSKIFWLEIITSNSGEFDLVRPGATANIKKYNQAIEKAFGAQFITLLNEVNAAGGVNSDHVHLNKTGHMVVSGLVSKKLASIEESR